MGNLTSTAAEQHKGVSSVIQALEAGQITPNIERRAQSDIVCLLNRACIPFQREYPLTESDRVDFLIEGGIALEVKVKGSPRATLRQVARYAKSSEVNAVVLVTSKAQGLPETLHGKPVTQVSIGRGWL